MNYFIKYQNLNSFEIDYVLLSSYSDFCKWRVENIQSINILDIIEF